MSFCRLLASLFLMSSLVSLLVPCSSSVMCLFYLCCFMFFSCSLVFSSLTSMVCRYDFLCICSFWYLLNFLDLWVNVFQFWNILIHFLFKCFSPFSCFFGSVVIMLDHLLLSHRSLTHFLPPPLFFSLGDLLW